MYSTIEEAAKAWVNRDFDNIPGSLLERAYKAEPEDLELLAGGKRECGHCGEEWEPIPDPDLEEDVCKACKVGTLKQSRWAGAEYAWPAGWGTLWHPNERADEDWIRDNAETVAACGFIVYEADETGILLGIDGGGYDFYAEHWMPLYVTRGLKWHESADKEGSETPV